MSYIKTTLHYPRVKYSHTLRPHYIIQEYRTVPYIVTTTLSKSKVQCHTLRPVHYPRVKYSAIHWDHYIALLAMGGGSLCEWLAGTTRPGAPSHSSYTTIFHHLHFSFHLSLLITQISFNINQYLFHYQISNTIISPCFFIPFFGAFNIRGMLGTL